MNITPFIFAWMTRIGFQMDPNREVYRQGMFATQRYAEIGTASLSYATGFNFDSISILVSFLKLFKYFRLINSKVRPSAAASNPRLEQTRALLPQPCSSTLACSSPWLVSASLAHAHALARPRFPPLLVHASRPCQSTLTTPRSPRRLPPRSIFVCAASSPSCGTCSLALARI